MNSSDLDKLEALEKAATEGQWLRADCGGIVISNGYDVVEDDRMSSDDERLICETRNALPELLRLARIALQEVICPGCGDVKRTERIWCGELKCKKASG